MPAAMAALSSLLNSRPSSDPHTNTSECCYARASDFQTFIPVVPELDTFLLCFLPQDRLVRFIYPLVMSFVVLFVHRFAY